MRRLPLALLALLLLLAAGCGAQASSGDEDFEGAQGDVAKVINDLQDAAVQDEPQKVCDDLLADALKRRAGADCPKVVDQAFDDVDTQEIDVRDVRVTGERARVSATTGTTAQQRSTFDLVRERGRWRIAAIG